MRQPLASTFVRASHLSHSTSGFGFLPLTRAVATTARCLRRRILPRQCNLLTHTLVSSLGYFCQAITLLRYHPRFLSIDSSSLQSLKNSSCDLQIIAVLNATRSDLLSPLHATVVVL